MGLVFIHVCVYTYMYMYKNVNALTSAMSFIELYYRASISNYRELYYRASVSLEVNKIHTKQPIAYHTPSLITFVPFPFLSLITRATVPHPLHIVHIFLGIWIQCS